MMRGSELERLDLNEKYFRLTRTSLVITGSPPIQAWIEVGKKLKEIETSVHWWIGDWLNYGQRAYGEKYLEAVEATGYEYSTVAHDKWVSRKIELCRRRQNLSWSHHAEVASLPPEDQEGLLDTAEGQMMTREELRQAVKEFKRRPALESPPMPTTWRLIFNLSSENMDGVLEDIWGNSHTIPDRSIHLVVTSPPYNNGTAYDVYHDDVNWHRYSETLKAVFESCHKKMATGGRIAVNVPNISNRPGLPSVFLPLEVSLYLLESGFSFREVITWVKADEGDVAGSVTASAFKTTAWGSWASPSNPFLRSITESVLVMQKDSATLPGGRADITPEEFRRWTCNVWFVPAVSNDKHPAVFPVELARRLVKLYSYADQTVLDPFMGIGTTALACDGRLFVGFDVSSEYCREAARRVHGADTP